MKNHDNDDNDDNNRGGRKIKGEILGYLSRVTEKIEKKKNGKNKLFYNKEVRVNLSLVYDREYHADRR